ncbi:hypothetical protein RP20_CCG027956 [Aedes albopictus]|nr:hypothetical protein RP20_CCG027956 [Aedes albopictus]
MHTYTSRRTLLQQPSIFLLSSMAANRHVEEIREKSRKTVFFDSRRARVQSKRKLSETKQQPTTECKTK